MPTPTDQHTRELRGLVELCLLPEPPHSQRRVLGDYELLEKIGKGGMGSVWRARQIGLQRDVAVKILHDDLASDSAFIEAFRQEAEITATLKHPGIVAVYEAGEADGTWFYAMEWVDADNLEEVLREHGTRPLREAVIMLRDAAEAVGHAHGKGVLHRDLKPSNLLVDAEGNVRVLDFGLARWDGPVSSGRTAPLLGTPYYVSPEQAAGTSSGAAADVYSLGAVLYRMLCGRVPFTGDTPMAVMDQARTELPLPLRRLNASVPEDIEVIVLKCLEKSPRLRYADAQELANDLTRWLEGKPVMARPIGIIGKFVRWTKREPLQAGLAAVLVLGASGTMWQFAEAANLRKAAKRDRDVAALQLTAVTMREGHRDEAIRLFTAAMNDEDIAEWGFPARWLREELIGQRNWQEIAAHQDKIWAITLANSQQSLVTASEDSVVAIRDSHTGNLQFSIEIPGSPTFGLCPYPDDQKLLATAMDGSTRVIDLRNRSWQSGPNGLNATWSTRSKDGAWWATLQGNPHFWEQEGVIEVWQGEPGAQLHRTYPGKRAAFSPDGKHVAIGRAEKKLRTHHDSQERCVVEIFFIKSGEKVAELCAEGSVGSVRSLAWSNDGQHLMAAEGKRLHCWQSGLTQPQWTHSFAAGIWQVATPNEKILATCSDQSWYEIDPATGNITHSQHGHRDEVWSIAVLPNGNIATGAKDGNLIIWPNPEHTEKDIITDAHTKAIFTAEGSLLTLKDSQLQVQSSLGVTRRLTTLRCRSLHGWDPSRGAVLAGGVDDDFLWIEPKNGTIVHRLERVLCTGKREYAPDASGVSAEGTVIYECTEDGIFLRDSSSGNTLHKLSAAPLPMITAALSDDGRFLVTSSASETRKARLYDLKTGKLQMLPHQRDEILACAFSPDGHWLATGGGESSVYLWDLQGNVNAPIARIEGHLESVNGLAFTPDGQWLASAGNGGTIRFTQTSTWDSGPSFPCPVGDGFLSFSSDGKWLTISTVNGQKLIYAP